MKAIIIIIMCLCVLAAALYLLFNWYVNHYFKKLNLRYPIDESKEVMIEKNIMYKENARHNLLMDVYRPENTGKVPAIIFLHGEGIEKILKDAKEWSFYKSYGSLAASKGFAGITFHRNRTNMNFKNRDVAEDILDAVDFVRKNADRWNIDKNRICIWGFSLGGLYLSMFLKDRPEYIKALISYYGLLDIKFRIKNLNEAHTDYQPENYLPQDAQGFPPLLVVKAAKDRIKGVNESQDHFIKVAQERKLPYELILHHTGKHTFDALNDNSETREVITRTWEFIERNL